MLEAARDSQLAWALERLQRDEPIALPTETVYGLAGRALHAKALSKIFQLKARPTFDPLIVHILGTNQFAPLVKKVEPLHEKLAARFWPGPLTMLFEKSSLVPDLCTSGSEWVALRAPAHPVFRKMLELLGEPLAAPSANRFGRISPTSAQAVIDELGPYGLDAVVDGGPCEKGIESTVVKILSHNEIAVLRPGAVSVEDLQSCVGPSVKVALLTSSSKVEAPGLLESHYAPRTPLHFFENEKALLDFVEKHAQNLNRFAFLEVFSQSFNGARGARSIRSLSSRGSDTEAAAALFQVLRELDESGAERILTLAGPTVGLGLAINDRLRRAGASTRSP